MGRPPSPTPPPTPTLLVTIEYPQEVMDGPPFSVLEAEVRAQFTDRTIDLLLPYDPDLLGAAGDLAELDGTVAMAQALLAYLSLVSTDVPDLAGARDAAATLRALVEATPGCSPVTCAVEQPLAVGLHIEVAKGMAS